MKLLTIGPVQMDKKIIHANDAGIPYFRNKDFSNKMFEIETKLKNILHAPNDYKMTILTCSGTGGMESVVATIPQNEKVLIINGGTFGKRFVEICSFYNIAYDELIVDFEQDLTKEMLDKFKGKGYFAILCNICETSIGKLYDKDLLNNFCKEENCYLIIDAISSIFADEYDLSKFNADITIFSSQKALALAPGISILMLSKKYIDNVVEKYPSRSYYLDIKLHLDNMKRGQTPFTPALAEIEQLYVRLNTLTSYQCEIDRIKNNVKYFRDNLKSTNFTYPKFNLSNCITPIFCPNNDADKVLEYLKNNGIYVNPCGGNYAKSMLRVGHVGNLSIKDMKKIIKLLRSYK